MFHQISSCILLLLLLLLIFVSAKTKAIDNNEWQLSKYDNQTLQSYKVRLSQNNLSILINAIKELELFLEGNKANDSEVINVRFTCQSDGQFSWNETDHQCDVFTLKEGFDYRLYTGKDDNHKRLNISLQSLKPGKQQLIGHVQYDQNKMIVDARQAYIMVNVGRSDTIIFISSIIGWIYFFAWSISFYPQIWDNFKRRSVVGLNFDYVALNLSGFISYSVFNVSFYFVPYVQEQFDAANPRSQIPVEVNDVVFGLHAVFATLVVIVQCLIYERSDQKISYFAQAMLAVIWVGYLVVGFIVTFTKWVTLLDFLYVFSYVKLTITIVKYIPQAWYNYRRKSTIGWSIGNIFLDSLGGALSIIQMFMLAYNYNDWLTIFKNFTKFGLGAVSIMFDVLFLLQHYVFYRHAPPSEAARLYIEHDEANRDDNSKANAQINYGAFDQEKF